MYCINIIIFNNYLKVLFGCIISTIVYTIILIFIKKKNILPENKFLIIASLIGICYILLIPPLKGIDEGAHFFKVYSTFNSIEKNDDSNNCEYDYVPETILLINNKISSYKDVLKFISIPIDSTNTVKSDEYIGAKLYSPISYIPYLIPFIIFQKCMKLSAFYIIMLSRLGAFIIWLACTYFCIKIIPKRKSVVAFFSLMPLMLTLVTTFTGDMITNLSIFLFIAIWYKIYEGEDKISNKEILLILILGILAVFSKVVYSLIFILIFFLPKDKFKSLKSKYAICISTILVLIVATILNMSLVGNNLLQAYPAIQQQKEFILSNPLEYLIVIFNTLAVFLTEYFFQFTTGRTTMCHNNVYIPNVISFLYWLILIIALFKDENVNINLKKYEKVSLVLIIISIVFIIFTSLYVQWTATNFGIGVNCIYGIQGRYFTPIVFLLVLTKGVKKLKFDDTFLWIGTVLLNYYTMLSILNVF
jgi:uncharacterized membrane protein